MSDSLSKLAAGIAGGCDTEGDELIAAAKGLFEDRYHKRKQDAPGLDQARPPFLRNAYMSKDDGVSYAGFINPDNPPSGPYGGMSLVWFPSDDGSMIDFGLGTRGLSPDEGILTRPGHRRRIAALRAQLAGMGLASWARQDPTAIGTPVPEHIRSQDAFQPFDHVFKRYGAEIYCMTRVPKDPSLAETVVRAYLDLYAYERRWQLRASEKTEAEDRIAAFNNRSLASTDEARVVQLLKERRYVVLEGPPGTGKSRLAGEILEKHYGNNGFVIQFHPSTTYEDFVAGLSPDIKTESLRFQPKAGSLTRAAALAKDKPALLVIDEMNRADLGRVLGEAVYLFEVEEGTRERTVRLPYPIGGQDVLKLPENLHVLATMNTADRNIARIDLAIRRRFAFAPTMPDREVVRALSTKEGLKLFDSLVDVFVEHAPDGALALLPGHSYFIAKDHAQLASRLRYELIPLIEEYLREGYLGPGTGALQAVRDQSIDLAME